MGNGPDGFDEVWGSAISKAVRRAVDGVGRDPLASLGASGGEGEAVADDVEEAEAPPPPLPADGTTDPYELLGVARSAAWDDITDAYRRRARAWHPDGAPEEEQARREELLRELNAAYAELRVRRGR